MNKGKGFGNWIQSFKAKKLGDEVKRLSPVTQGGEVSDILDTRRIYIIVGTLKLWVDSG